MSSLLRPLNRLRELRSPSLLRPLTYADRAPVLRDLGPVLAASYPGGNDWLDARLVDSLEGEARCRVIMPGRRLQAISIETPKGRGRVKLSTIWVAPGARGRGLGGVLADHCVATWLDRDIDEAWVTAATQVTPAVEQLLVGRGFCRARLELERYGPRRDEVVLSWTRAAATRQLTGASALLPQLAPPGLGPAFSFA